MEKKYLRKKKKINLPSDRVLLQGTIGCYWVQLYPLCTQALYGYFFLGSINLYGSAAQRCFAPLDKSKWAR